MADETVMPPHVLIDPTLDYRVSMTRAEYTALPLSDSPAGAVAPLCRPDRGNNQPIAYARVPAGTTYLGRVLDQDMWRMIIVDLSGESPSDVG